MKGYKTVLFNIMQAGAGIAIMFGINIDPSTMPADSVSNFLCGEMPEIAGGALTVSGVANILLRIFTNTSIFKKV